MFNYKNMMRIIGPARSRESSGIDREIKNLKAIFDIKGYKVRKKTITKQC